MCFHRLKIVTAWLISQDICGIKDFIGLDDITPWLPDVGGPNEDEVNFLNRYSFGHYMWFYLTMCAFFRLISSLNNRDAEPSESTSVEDDGTLYH